jgi:protein involved in polysaccharide export with SLBB domain
MLANHAVTSPATDNNGPGVPFSVTVGVHAPGDFSSASLLVIDKAISAANGPTPTTAANGEDYDRPERVFGRHPDLEEEDRRSRVTKKR